MALAGWIFYVGPLLTLPLFLLPKYCRDRRIRFLVTAGAISFVGLALEVFFAVHYAALSLGLILALILQGMRHLRDWRWEGRPTGLFLVRSYNSHLSIDAAGRGVFAAVSAPASTLRTKGWSARRSWQSSIPRLAASSRLSAIGQITTRHRVGIQRARTSTTLTWFGHGIWARPKTNN